jgi:hypothetical protein
MKVTDLKIGDKVKHYRYFTGEVVGLSKLGAENVEVKLDNEDGVLRTTTCNADELTLIKPENNDYTQRY